MKLRQQAQLDLTNIEELSFELNKVKNQGKYRDGELESKIK